MLPFDPMGYAQNYSWATSSMATGGRKDGLFTRSSNAVRYDGEFSGFKFGALYGFGNVPGSMKTSSKYDFAVGYETGPFAAVVTFVGGLLLSSVAVRIANLAVHRAVRRWDRTVTAPALAIVWIAGIALALSGHWFGTAW
ncbi:hypothetical protein P2L35_14240, partial [Enterococcus faecium]|nr:hypothetical protein [Enterococcus faecium]